MSSVDVAPKTFEYSYKLKLRAGWEATLTLSGSTAPPSQVKVGSVKQAGGRERDVTGGKISGTKGKRVEDSITAGLLKAEFGESYFEVVPGLKAKVEGSLGEVKLDGAGNVSADLMKLGFVADLTINAPDKPGESAGNELLDLLLDDLSLPGEPALTVKLVLKGSVAINPGDLKHLAEIRKLLPRLEEQIKELDSVEKAINKEIEAVKKAEQELQDLRKAGPGSKGKEAFEAAKKELYKKHKALAKALPDKITALKYRIKEIKAVHDECKEKIAAAMGKITSKVGKSLAVEATQEILKKTAARFIPVINWLATLKDLVQALGLALHAMEGGEIGVGLPPEDNDPSKAGGSPPAGRGGGRDEGGDGTAAGGPGAAHNLDEAAVAEHRAKLLEAIQGMKNAKNKNVGILFANKFEGKVPFTTDCFYASVSGKTVGGGDTTITIASMEVAGNEVRFQTQIGAVDLYDVKGIFLEKKAAQGRVFTVRLPE